MGDDGRVDVHGVHLAHVHDVDGPLLHAQVPDEVRPQQDEGDGAREDRLRVDRLDGRVQPRLRARLHRLLQRVHGRPTMYARHTQLRHLWLHLRLLRAAVDDDRHVRSYDTNPVQQPEPAEEPGRPALQEVSPA